MFNFGKPIGVATDTRKPAQTLACDKFAPRVGAQRLWFPLAMLCLVVAAFAAYVHAEKQIEQASERRHISFVLADQLRQSSDELTRMARTYVATGDPIYKAYYQDIIDIRNGAKPQPDPYLNVYWGLVLGGAKLPQLKAGHMAALLDQFRQMGFAEEELQGLAEAKANSDALTAIEYEAMGLIERGGPDAVANQAKASRMVHDAAYHLAKANIMIPISAACALMDKRTADSVNASKQKAARLRWLFVGCVLGLLFVFWRAHCIGRNNIVELQLAEEAALAANQKLALHFDQTPLAVIEWDKKFCVTRWNSAAESIFGFSAAEAIGQHATFIIPEADHPFVAPVLDQLLQGSGGGRSTNDNLRKDGELILCEWYNTSLRDGSGQVLGVASQVQDITERKRAEAAMRASEAMYRQLLDCQGEGFTVVDAQECFLMVNPAAEKIFGTKPGTLVGRCLLDFLPSDQQDLIRSQSRLRSQGIHSTYESQIRREDGTLRTLLVTATPWLYPGSEGFQTIGVCRDITEQKEAEAKMLDMTARVSLAARAGGVGIWDYDVVNNRLAWDDQMYRLYGLTADQFGGAYEAWMAGLHPEDAAREDAKVQMALRGEKDFNTEFRVVWADGSIHSIRALGLVQRDASGQPLHIIGTNWDITEGKQAEEALRESEGKFRDLFERHSAIKLVIDPNTGKIIDANEAATAFYGWSIDQIKQMHIQQINTLSGEATKNEMEKARSSGCNHFEFRHRRADGSIRDVEVFSNRIESMGKELLYSIVHDITQRNRLEAEKAELEEQNHQLQKAESLGVMAASIGHHFNNKLQAVMANLEVLSALPKGGDPTKYLAMAKLASEKAAAVSRQMLLYLGNIPGERAPVCLGALCAASLPLLHQALPNGVTLESACPEPGPIITGNGEQLQQLLANLVTNAGEAMGAAGGCVRLSLSTCPASELPTAHRFPIGWQPQGADHACLEVADTGVGIPGADIVKLFDPFYTTKFTGRGLGLSVVLGLVQAHGGAITVASQPGQGSVFRVFLPVSTEEVSRPLKGAFPASEQDSGGTLLLVDDDEMLLESACPLLGLLGFTVLAAKDGIEALEVFRQHQADIRCVITDLTMPRLDGWGLLSALRQLDPTLPVILASGYDKAQVLAGGHLDQPQAYLSKPFSLEQVRVAVNEALAPAGLLNGF